MRDLHVADVGDFGKFGLLRWLVGPDDLGRQLSLGVIWYYNREQAFDYVNPPQFQSPLALLDPELYKALATIAMPRLRMVELLQTQGLLPDDTIYFREEIPTGNGRVDWFQRAMDVVRDCDLVFLDPDNGLVEISDAKYATYAEAAQLWRMGKSLVVYQSFGRAGAEIEIQRHAAHLRRELEIDGPLGEIFALRFRRRFARVFFVIPNPANRKVVKLMRERVDSFMASCWGDHFTRVDC